MKNRTNASIAALLLATVCLVGAHAIAAPDGDAYSEGWGPQRGSLLPLLDADNHNGVRVQLADLVGREGLLLVLVRSADW